MAIDSHPVPALTDLYVYVTDRCNLACVHCWIVSSEPAVGGKAGHFVKPEHLDAAIVEAMPLGLSALKWTGGEPTIHPDFPALLAIQKKYGLQGRMETNGVRITPELAQMLAESGVTHISVSLDGAVSATHDAIRGMRGAYDRALTGVRNLVEIGYRPQLIMSLMRANVAEVDDLLLLAERVGAGSVKFNIVQPTLRGEQLHNDNQALTVPELIALHWRVEHELAERFSFPIFFDIPIAFRSLTRILANGASHCGIHNILGLLPDGSYALCGIGINVPEMVFGHVGEGALETIWRNHEILIQIREDLPTNLTGICGRCLMKIVCLGACVAQTYYAQHDLSASFWFCAEADRLELFPYHRADLSVRQQPTNSLI